MKKQLYLVLLLVVAALQAMPQPSKKKLERKANADFEEGNYTRAWTTYRSLLGQEPKHEKAGIKAAQSSMMLKYPVDSLKLLSANLSSSSLPEALYFRAVLAHREKRFDESIGLLESYTKSGPKKKVVTEAQSSQLISAVYNAKEIVSKPTTSKVRNMGGAINSKYADYAPVIMPDESALYFTSRRETPEHPTRNGDNTFFEDVYVSYRKNGQWSPAENAGFPLNTETNDACVAISPDGQRMIMFRTAADIITGDLYIARLGANERWDSLEQMGADINSPFIETSACFSADTNEIYFSSDRPGGLGGKDLYRIKKLPDGTWSPALNLGPAINTRYDDDAPFMHPDGVTLYFSSEGHNSIGGHDVFRSVWNKEKREFSKAENLGYPINDVGNDIFFVISVDGQRAYYCTWRSENMGGTDLYEIETHFDPNNLEVRTGRVLTGNNYGQATITLTDQASGDLYGIYNSHGTSGKFVMLLRPGKTYEALIEADGYEPVKQLLNEDFLQKNNPLKFILSKK